MPNPLLTAIASPTPSAKPPGTSADPSEQKTEGSFEAVLDEQIKQQAEGTQTPELPAQETESDPSEPVEDDGPADTTPNIVAAPDSGLRQVSLLEPKGEAPGNTLAARVVSDQSDKSVSGQQNTGELAGGGAPQGRFEISENDPAPAVRLVRTANEGRNAPISTESRPLRSSGFRVPPTPDRNAPPLAELPKTDALPNRDTSSGTPQNKTPAASGTAQPFVQMQLMATQETQAEAEVPDVEDTQHLRDNSPLQTGRESTSATHAFGSNARAEMARAIAGQMAAVIHARPQTGAIEIALNPEELGRVSIVLNGRDDGVHLTIAAERPETLDFMRRHISVLEAEFRALGFGDLSFDLGTSSDAHQNDHDDRTHSPFEPEQDAHFPATAQAPSRVGAAGRIDIRL